MMLLDAIYYLYCLFGILHHMVMLFACVLLYIGRPGWQSNDFYLSCIFINHTTD